MFRQTRIGLAVLTIGGALLVPAAAAFADDGGLVHQAIVLMRRADERIENARTHLRGVDAEVDGARAAAYRAELLLDEAGVHDGRLDQARDELREAERSADAAHARARHAEELIDAALKQARGETGA
jgi:hypothetical protein